MKDKLLAYTFFIILGVGLLIWAGPKFVDFVSGYVSTATETITIPKPGVGG